MKKHILMILCLLLVISFTACSGSGEDDYEYVDGQYVCQSCDGYGKTKCTFCSSTGYKNGDVCKICKGSGRVNACYCDGTGLQDAIFKQYKDGRREFSHYK